MIKGLKLITVGLLGLALSACVTTTESRLTQKKSPEKAVENYTALGLGYLNTGHPHMARDRLVKALNINNDYSPANDAMGLLWQSEGEYDLAEDSFKKAIKDDKKNIQAYHHLGRLYSQQKEFKKAIKELSFAAEDRFYDNRVGAYNDMALTYYRMGDTSAAMDSYNNALRVSPYNVDALVNMSTLKFEAQQYDESQKYFDRLDRLVQGDQAIHTPHSLWLGIRLASIAQNTERVIHLASSLKQQFPQSQEYRLYRESLNGAK